MGVGTREWGEGKAKREAGAGRCGFTVPGGLELVGQQEGGRCVEGCRGRQAAATGLGAKQLFSVSGRVMGAGCPVAWGHCPFAGVPVGDSNKSLAF